MKFTVRGRGGKFQVVAGLIVYPFVGVEVQALDASKSGLEVLYVGCVSARCVPVF